MSGDEVRQLIESLRVPHPDECDWCGKEVSSDDLIPEEAGEWICRDCWERTEDA